MDNLPASISALASASPREREQAANHLFRIGCTLAEPVLRNWFADREFRALARTGSSLLTVGVAVRPSTFEAIRHHFGQAPLSEVPDQDVLEFELTFTHGVRLDILTCKDPEGNGAIARYLRRFGEGVQQVECDVRNVERATEILRSRFKIEPLYPQSREGADRTRVNFFLVPLPDGSKILIELVEVRGSKKGR